MLSGIEAEVRKQPVQLRKLEGCTLEGVPAGSLFVGAGDSYIVAQSAAILSSYRCFALDPYFLLASPGLAKGRTVVFISVSGRTRANVAAARRVEGIARKTVAITSNPGSPLTEATQKSVRVPYQYRPRMPGTLGFSLSLLAALKLARVDTAADFAKMFSLAESRFNQVRFSGRGTTFFLGNGGSYAASLYATAKTYEFFGTRAQSQLLEEFSHMELFSLEKKDAVNAFSSSDPSRMGKKVVRALEVNGYTASSVASEGTTDAERLFYEVFLLQLSFISEMKRRGLDTPGFLKSKQKLDVSDAMIY